MLRKKAPAAATGGPLRRTPNNTATERYKNDQNGLDWDVMLVKMMQVF